MADVSGIRPDVWRAFRACRLWRAASDGAVAELARAARVQDLPRGTHLAVEGDPAREFGLIVAGRARTFYLGPDGKQITFETLEAGDPYAAVAALAGGRYPANVDATTDVTVATLPSSALFDLMAREPAVARSLVSDLATRVVNFTSVIHTLALDVPGRLARYLFYRALQSGRPSPRGVTIDIGMPKGELALALGTVPETLSRAFGRLKDEGIIEVHGRSVTILDVRRLASLGSGYSEE